MGGYESLRECRRWSIPENDGLDIASVIDLVPGHRVHSPQHIKSNFMMHTTVTMRDATRRCKVSGLATKARMKQECVLMCSRMSEHNYAKGETELEAFYRLSR